MHTNGQIGADRVSRLGPALGRFRGWRVVIMSSAVMVTAAVSACGAVTSSPPGELGELQRIASTCRPTPPAAMVQLDGTGSSNGSAITAERMDAVESVTRETAVCSGRLRVVVFSSSSAATVTLFDDALRPQGATRNARLRRVPKLVKGAVAQIRRNYASAVAALPGGGSDITAQYRLAQEWAAQLGGGYRLRLAVFTDGFQTVGVDFYKKALTKREAIALAARTTVPKLPGASVTTAGLGRVAGDPPRSAVVDGLVAYYDALCARTGANECTSVTDYTEGRQP